MNEVKKNRIVHVLGSGLMGGMERSVYTVVKHMHNQEESAVCVAFGVRKGPFVAKIESIGVKTWIAGTRNGWDVMKLPKIWLFMRSFNIHHFHHASLVFMVASCLCRLKLRVYTNRAGFHEFPSFRKKLRNCLMGFMLRHFFTTYSGNTAWACEDASVKFRIPRSLFHVVYNGVDFDQVVAKRNRNEVLAELGLPTTTRIVGTCACLKAWKRVEKLVYLAKMLPETTRIVIVGDGPENARLCELASDLSLTHKILFLGQKVDPFDYVGIMDVFVLPSNAGESFGNAAVEAMALGIPTVVYADGGGLVEHIVPGKTGFIVKDDGELHATVVRLLDDSRLRAEVGNSARDYVRSRYSLDRMLEGYLQLYDLNGSRSVGASR